MNSTYQYIKKLLYSVGIVIISLTMLVSCDSCNPYVKKSAVIILFTAESTNVTQEKEATVKYNVTNWVSGRFEADYNHDGTISESEKDTVSNYDGGDATFTTRKLENLGDLEIKLIVTGEDGNEVSAKTSVKVIAHALPDISASDFTVVEGKTVTFELPTVSGVEYTTIKTLNDSSKVLSSSVDASSNKMTIQVSDDVTEQGSYDVQLGYNIPETGITGTLSKTGNVIENLCRIQARIELSSDPGTLQPGETRLYNEETMASEGDWLAQQNSSDGLVDIKANAPAAKISLQAKGLENSFIFKSITLDGTKDYLIKNGQLTIVNGEVTNHGQVIIRPALGVNGYTLEGMRTQHLRTNSGYCGLIKPDLRYMEILRSDPDGSGGYTEALQNQLATLLRTDQSIKNFVGKDLGDRVQVDGENNVPPTGYNKNYSLIDLKVCPNNYYVIWVPSPNASSDEVVQFFEDGDKTTGKVVGARIKIRSDKVNAAIVKHALGHAIYAYRAHIQDAYGKDSIMANTTDRTDYGDVDYFMGDSTKDDTYYEAQPTNRSLALKWGPYESL